MPVILSGANPGVRLLDGDTVTAFASVWSVDWSERGAGNALVLWHDDTVRVLGADTNLASWLAALLRAALSGDAGLPWPEPVVEQADVSIALNLTSGLLAHAADVEVSMSGVLGHRTFSTDDFALDGVPHSLQLLLAPVSDASITVAGTPLPGTVTVGGTEDRPSSSAFLATAEVWSR